MPRKKTAPAPIKDYGNETVSVIPSKDIIPLLNKNAVTAETFIHKNHLISPIRTYCRQNAESMLRTDAETNEDYLQIITYTILHNNGRIYCTHRLGGDPRLTGKYSIGIGGHVSGDEEYSTTVYREILEEVNLRSSDYSSASFVGYIYCNTAPVNRVHLGFLFVCNVSKENLVCREKDKLAGEWKTVEELKALDASGQLEDWSRLAFNHLYGGTHRAQ